MIEPVIPSFLRVVRDTSDDPPYDGGMFDNNLLRFGEVVKIIYPDDDSSISRKIIEYDVLVQHRENNTAVTKIYHNCILINPLASLADKAFWTLRVDKAVANNNQNEINDGMGSKVLILCINGEHGSAVIIGGIRDTQDADLEAKQLGHHAFFIFNGVSFNVNDDGSFELVYGGKSFNDGTIDQNQEDIVGSTIQVTKDGSLRIFSQKQSFFIDNTNKTTVLTAEKDLTLDSEKIHIGQNADEQAVLGNQLAQFISDLIDQIVAITVNSPVGITTPPLNATAFQSLKARVNDILSGFIFVKK